MKIVEKGNNCGLRYTNDKYHLILLLWFALRYSISKFIHIFFKKRGAKFMYPKKIILNLMGFFEKQGVEV